MLYGRRLETSDGNHKLIRKLFIELINQVSSGVISFRVHGIVFYCSLWSSSCWPLHRDTCGFTLQTRKLCPLYILSMVYEFKLHCNSF